MSEHSQQPLVQAMWSLRKRPSDQFWSLAPILFKCVMTDSNQTIKRLFQEAKKNWITLPPVGLCSTPMYPWILWIYGLLETNSCSRIEASLKQKRLSRLLLMLKAGKRPNFSYQKPDNHSTTLKLRQVLVVLNGMLMERGKQPLLKEV